MWKVYILQCSDNTRYTGITNDLDKRIEDHNNGTGAKYTSGRRPVHIIYSQDAKDRSEASKEERRIKRLPKKKKLELVDKD